MEIDSGLRGILKAPWVFGLYQWLVGANSAKKWLAKNVWNIRDGQTIVDAGCGPGILVHYLPKAVNYFGFDISEPYISTAQSTFPDRGEFVCGDAARFIDEKQELKGAVDIVLTFGVLHHLDDEAALELLRAAHQLLKSGGRYVSFEPTFLRHQQWLSRWVISMDRGQNVRHEHQWQRLVGSVFTNHETSIITGLYRIPFTSIIIEAKK
ncbi:MAG: class I SAM-dependent methyltransferase [Planctomycetes bacterium]|nr:class I SAM-dependent methyltransferase [Planctomycetota bacterium]